MNPTEYLSLPPSKLRRRRLILLSIVVAAIAITLLSARPWELRQNRCALTVRPGESVQAAVDAAQPGDVICLARGTWTDTVIIDKPLTLTGRGAGRTTIQAALITGSAGQNAGRDADLLKVRLERLTISGRGGGSAIEISGQASVEVSDCTITGLLYGVWVSDSASLTLTGSTVSDSPQRGIVLTDSARASIINSGIKANRGLGLWLSGSAQATLLDSEVSGNNGHGFWLWDEAQVMLTNSSVSENRGHGIWLTGQSEAELQGTDVFRNHERGVMAEGEAKVELNDSRVLSNWHGVELTGEARATLTACTLSQNAFDGIRVQHSAHASVSASVISANRRGLWLGGSAAADIRNSLIEKNAGYGAFSWSRAEVTGEGNRFLANGVDMGGNLSGTLRLPLKEPREAVITWPDEGYASLQEAVDALLPGGRLIMEQGEYTAALTVGKALKIEADAGQVTLKGKGDALPVLSLVDGADLHLSGATISGGAEGLLVSAGAGALLVNTTVSGNGVGISLSHVASAELVGSSITGNERHGIVASGGARAIVASSLISGNREHGIGAADSAQIIVNDSIIAGNGVVGGVVLWGSSQATLEANTMVDNAGFGVAIFQRPPFWQSPWVFRGLVSGHGNVFDGNRRGDVSPPELEFLSTDEGGELDRRE